MADYFTNFSLILKLPDAAAQKYVLDLAIQAQEIMYESAAHPANFPASLVEILEDWPFETEAETAPDHMGVWMHSNNGGLDAVFQHLLKRFGIKERVAFKWAK